MTPGVVFGALALFLAGFAWGRLATYPFLWQGSCVLAPLVPVACCDGTVALGERPMVTGVANVRRASGAGTENA
jgi:hypothetical protein